jgi:hypothetical protein
MKKTYKNRKRNRHTKTNGSFARKGGATNKVEQSPGIIRTLGTMVMFGVSALLVGPLYLLAELLNIPLASLNTLSRKAFDGHPQSFLHVPVYKMIKGCPNKKMTESDFVLQEDMYIDNSLAVISCDKEKKHEIEVHENNTSFSDSFLDIFGLIPSDRKLRYHVFRLFEYIENIRETDEQRKIHIHKLIRQISDYKTLIKCYLIYRTLDSSICKGIKAEKKTILKDEDIVQIVNPFYIPCAISYSKRLSCAFKHLTQKRFNKNDPSDQECKPNCDTCTFRNSASRLTKKYFNLFAGGSCNSSVVRDMFNTYFTYVDVEMDLNQIPKDENGIIPFLNKIKVKSELAGKIEASERDIILKKFNTFMCKYDIMPIVEDQIKKKVKDRIQYHTMESSLKFIVNDSMPKKKL